MGRIPIVTSCGKEIRKTKIENQITMNSEHLVGPIPKLIDMAHADMVKQLSVSGEAVLRRTTAATLELNHMVVGISGEAGELLDAVKKFIYYDRPLDMTNIVEELGDLEFYMEGLRERLGITREQTLRANMEKLAKRYPDFKYSDRRAQERADKA